MTYEQLLKTGAAVLRDPDIAEKNRLIMTYNLPKKIFNNLHQEIFYKTEGNTVTTQLPQSDEFEVEIDVILFKFIKIL